MVFLHLRGGKYCSQKSPESLLIINCHFTYRVRWHLTGVEGVYRYGGDGGRFDIAHVEVNEKETRIHKRHPLPESAEQCAARHGFGFAKKYNIILRLRKRERKENGTTEYTRDGVLEWPDFGAGIRVECMFHEDGAVSITERELLYGSKDCGWEPRFGQPSYVPGNIIVVSPTRSSNSSSDTIASDNTPQSYLTSPYEELLGCSSFSVQHLRNRVDASKLRVTSEMRLLRDITHVHDKNVDDIQDNLPVSAHMPPPIHFDAEFHAPSISLSLDGRTISCVSEGRGTAFGSVGFSKGVHYWEVKLEQADIGSVFVGVAEKPSQSGSSSTSSSFSFDGPPRLNRWLGWGFVNFRATYTSGAERVYGAHCHAGDTVGVLLDCDAGRVSFFFDGVKYGEHIMNDLGCAFENISPFGFNADGCGSGGYGGGAPSAVEGGRGGRYPANGNVRPRALWPVVGLRSKSDRVTFGNKWMTGIGVDGVTSLHNALDVDEILCAYQDNKNTPSEKSFNVPKWFIKESYFEYERWRSNQWLRCGTRGSLGSIGLDVYLDASPISCAAACTLLGLDYALLSGDRVIIKRSAGRLLELPEEAIVLGAFQGRLFYRIVSQKSEGGSLSEGGGRSWFWDESEVVDIQLLGEAKGLGVELPLLDRFKCAFSGGLKIVYVGGAVIRSDLEIFDGSANIGAVPHGTVIPHDHVLERRINSAGVVRYRIRFQETEGWISSRIRGGKEEAIVEPLYLPLTDKYETSHESNFESEHQLLSPQDSVRVWWKHYKEKQKPCSYQDNIVATTKVNDVNEFENLISSAKFSHLTQIESDSLLSSVVTAAADFSSEGDPLEIPFEEVLSAISFAALTHKKADERMKHFAEKGSMGGHHAVAAVLASVKDENFPSIKAMLARIALLRALNRRGKAALPWLPLRPVQEGSSVFGGLLGYGASIVRVGRTQSSSDTSKVSM